VSNEVVLEWGLKDNYKDLKENFNIRFGGHFRYISPFFAYNKDDMDMAYVFENEHELKVFLERVWYDDCSDSDDMENSMSEWFVWKFIDEVDIKKWPTLHPNAKPTSIVCDGLRVFRERYEIKVEPCIYINLNRKQ
jgi:hypothetical protein